MRKLHSEIRDKRGTVKCLWEYRGRVLGLGAVVTFKLGPKRCRGIFRRRRGAGHFRLQKPVIIKCCEFYNRH